MKGIVVVPTYNEGANISRLLDEILRQDMDVEILVVDDDSPDGTSSIVKARMEKEPRIKLLRRKGKRGRGLAGIDAFRRAAKSSVDYVIEMDADFSHPPSLLPHFLPALEKADVVIASRLIPGGSEPQRNLLRKIVTKAACWWIRFWLGIPVVDTTSGYRCFRRSVLTRIDWDNMVSVGPSIVEEILWALERTGARMVEIPLAFQPRAAGESQLNIWKLLDTLVLVTKLRFKSPPINR